MAEETAVLEEWSGQCPQENPSVFYFLPISCYCNSSTDKYYG